MLAGEGQGALADLQFPPPLHVDQEHAGIEVRRIGRQTERAVEGIPREIGNRAQRLVAQIGRPELTDVVAHDDVAVEVQDPGNFARQEIAD